mmetsp:Transcript_35619/g.79185  ORF Transcript_35619/g.79185 Transcript_35619/m.79185 type:complete len:298 (+) Transcript_35619:1020-1913(+)
MVRGDQPSCADAVRHLQQLLEALVNCLNRPDGGLKVTCVAHHIWVCVVDAHHLVLAALEGLLACCSDLKCLHVGLLVENNLVRGDLQVGLQLAIKVAGPVAVPKKGNVAKLLGLGAGKGGDAVLGQVLPTDVQDLRGGNQVVGGQLEVAVVLHHAHKAQVLGQPLPVKVVKLGVLKRFGHLYHAVGPEVEEDHRVTVLHGAHGLPGCVHNDKGVQVLIRHGLVLGAPQSLHGRECVSEVVGGLAKHVGVPTTLDNVPVGLVAIHGYAHAATTRSDLSIATLGIVSLELLLQSGDEAN